MPVINKSKVASTRVASILKSPEATRRSLNVHFQMDNEIVAAITSYLAKEDATPYIIILQHLKNETYTEGQLLVWLQKLSKNIHLLSSRCEGLISGLLQINWASQSEAVIQGYENFCAILVSAHTNNLKLVLLQLIKKLMPTGNAVDEGYVRTISPLEEKVFSNVHRVIRAIITVSPSTPSSLLALLCEEFPYIEGDSHSLLCYIRNLLCATRYLPQFRRSILELLAGHLIKMDVLCPKEEVQNAGVCYPNTNQDMDVANGMLFEMECDDDKTNELDSKSPFIGHKLANLLDRALHKVFNFIKEECWSQGVLNWETTKSLYKDLLWIFERIILPTNAPCHVQFIMFYVCSFRQELCDGFLDYLWKRIEDPNTPVILRQSAVCYIGSLLARGTYIRIQTVTACFDVMVTWLHRYIDSQDGSRRAYPDVTLHGPFFSVCQSVFYVFAFRHKELLEMEGGFDYLNKLNFGRIVSCCLNPLKFCLPPITQNFASLARNYQLAYCYTIIEKNNRATLQVASQLPGHDVVSTKNALDSFFPFDPYSLYCSSKFIENIYRYYQGVPLDVEPPKKEEEAEDDFLDEEIVSSPGRTGMHIPDFLLYSTSPGFKPSGIPQAFLNDIDVS